MTSPASPQPGKQDEPPTCRCGHSFAKHLGWAGQPSDPCGGGTPGFCGCTGYRAAAAADQPGKQDERPAWAGTILESCIRDVALGRIASHSSVTPELIAEWWRLNPDRVAETADQPGAGGEADGQVEESKPPWAYGRVFPCTVTDELALPGGDSEPTPPAPSAGQDTGQLREDLAADLCRIPRVWVGDLGPGEIAEMVASLPALARLITERDEARAQVQRVAAEALRDAADTYDEAWPGIDPVTTDLRNRADALDPQ